MDVSNDILQAAVGISSPAGFSFGILITVVLTGLHEIKCTKTLGVFAG